MFIFIKTCDLSLKILFFLLMNTFKTSDEKHFKYVHNTRVRSDSGKIDILNHVAQNKVINNTYNCSVYHIATVKCPLSYAFTFSRFISSCHRTFVASSRISLNRSYRYS